MFTIADKPLLRNHVPRVAFFLTMRYYSSSAPKRAEFRKESALGTGRVNTIQLAYGQKPAGHVPKGRRPASFLLLQFRNHTIEKRGSKPVSSARSRAQQAGFLLSFSRFPEG